MNIFKSKDKRLYNILFPAPWLLLFPLTWIIILPANFIIDSLLLLVVLKFQKQTDVFAKYRSSIIKVWIFGFISDLIAAFIITVVGLIANSLGNHDLANALYLWPIYSVWAIVIIVLSVVVASICIYFFNLKVSFKKLEISIRQKKILALCFAIFTSPIMIVLSYLSLLT